jgi:adenosylcobinamide-GDP ribazoletransferase
VIQPVADLPASTSPSPVRRWQGMGGGLRAAIMLLTRIPTGSGDSSPAARAWASGWFPLVGSLVGVTSAAAGVGCTRLLGPHLGAVVAVAVGILLTGALHEDGLGDTADALGGARDRGQIFTILKDSRHGTYGVLALVLAVILRIGAIDKLGLELGAPGPAALVLAAIVSRTAMVALLAALPYVTPTEVSRSADVARTGAPQLAWAATLCAGGCGGLFALGWSSPGGVAGGLAAATATTLLLGWRFAVRAGGITGDFLGAGQQLTEISVLLTTIALLR